jgi:hypothetical protein
MTGITLPAIFLTPAAYLLLVCLVESMCKPIHSVPTKLKYYIDEDTVATHWRYGLRHIHVCTYAWQLPLGHKNTAAAVMPAIPSDPHGSGSCTTTWTMLVGIEALVLEMAAKVGFRSSRSKLLGINTCAKCESSTCGHSIGTCPQTHLEFGR